MEAGGIGAAAGPLIGGLITSALTWRAAFVFQALVVALIIVLSRRVEDPLPADPTRDFDTGGAILSAVGLLLVVDGRPGHRRQRLAGGRPAAARRARPGLVLLMGVSFVVAGDLQVVRDYDAVRTGLIFTAATLGLLASSLGAERFAARREQRTLVMAGFAVTVAGIAVLVALSHDAASAWARTPGLLLIGLGLGVMLTPR